MAFKTKNAEDKPISAVEDIDKLIRFKRLGIPLLPAQERALEQSNRGMVVSNQQKDARLLNEVIYFMRGTAGAEAYKQGYYTELFQHMYGIGRSQMLTGNPISLTAPDPIPTEMLAMAYYRSEHRKTKHKDRA
jgi:hypothetical protein